MLRDRAEMTKGPFAIIEERPDVKLSGTKLELVVDGARLSEARALSTSNNSASGQLVHSAIVSSGEAYVPESKAANRGEVRLIPSAHMGGSGEYH